MGLATISLCIKCRKPGNFYIPGTIWCIRCADISICSCVRSFYTRRLGTSLQATALRLCKPCRSNSQVARLVIKCTLERSLFCFLLCRKLTIKQKSGLFHFFKCFFLRIFGGWNGLRFLCAYFYMAHFMV